MPHGGRPPLPVPARLLVDTVPANPGEPHAGNCALLAGWSRIDGYAGLSQPADSTIGNTMPSESRG